MARRIRSSRKKLEMVGDFVLTDYVQRTLLQRKQKDTPLISVMISPAEEAWASYNSSMSSSWMVLVDLSVHH